MHWGFHLSPSGRGGTRSGCALERVQDALLSPGANNKAETKDVWELTLKEDASRHQSQPRKQGGSSTQRFWGQLPGF